MVLSLLLLGLTTWITRPLEQIHPSDLYTAVGFLAMSIYFNKNENK